MIQVIADMVDKEIKRMKRGDLLDILVQQNREIERLQQELEAANQELASRRIKIETSGSIAEASLMLNGVFEAAQAACQQYIDNVKLCSEEKERICAEMERQTKETCDQMIAEAQEQVDAYWEQANLKINQVLKESEGLKKLLSLE